MIFLTLISFFFAIHANELCKTDEEIIIACTVECGDTYKKALAEAGEVLGYRVKVITLIENPSSKYDGLLSPGGGDIHFRYYTDKKYNNKILNVDSLRSKIQKDYKDFSGERSKKGLKRDQFEVTLWQKYFSEKKFEKIPAIGICYGMQMLGVSNGMPMHVDIEKDFGIKPRRKILERVDIHHEKDITKILSRPLIGYYNHHQALHYDFYKKNRKHFEKNFEIIASSNEGQIPEMLRFKKRNAFGTQFHPERSTDHHRKNAIELFKWFLEKACLKKTTLR